jgi:hypothetical protein
MVSPIGCRDKTFQQTYQTSEKKEWRQQGMEKGQGAMKNGPQVFAKKPPTRRRKLESALHDPQKGCLPEFLRQEKGTEKC